MTRKNNKGFSLIEVIIAVAVFAILIVPLTSQLISAININKRSTKKQYAIDKAQEIMESFKTVDIGGSTLYIPDGTTATTTSTESDGSTTTATTTDNYKFTLSGGSSTKKTATMTVTNTDGTTSPMTVEYNVCTYTCNDISLGGAYAKYNCTVEVDDLAYKISQKGYVLEGYETDANGEYVVEDGKTKAVLKSDSTGTSVTTASKAGTTRALDNKQAAVIVGATYMSASANSSLGNNLDNLAYDHFREQKVDALKSDSKYEVYYSQYLSSGGDSFFANDTMEKTTTIKVAKKSGATDVYVVTCEVQYVDKPSIGIFSQYYANHTGLDTYKPTTKYGDGIVYQQEYTLDVDDAEHLTEILPVYLIYVPATSNGVYCAEDDIHIDLSDLAAEDRDNIKMYLFESVGDTNVSKEYKEIILKTIYGDDYIANLKTLYGDDYTKYLSLDGLVYENTSSTRKASSVKVNVNQVDSAGTVLNSDAVDTAFADGCVFANFTTNSTYGTDSNIHVLGTSEDEDTNTYLYNITVTLEDQDSGTTTTISGTRGK